MFWIWLLYFRPRNAICSSYVFLNIAIFSCSNSSLWKFRTKWNFISFQHWRTCNRNIEAFRCGYYVVAVAYITFMCAFKTDLHHFASFFQKKIRGRPSSPHLRERTPLLYHPHSALRASRKPSRLTSGSTSDCKKWISKIPDVRNIYIQFL